MQSSPVVALAADADGNISELQGYQAVGMSGETISPLTNADTIPLPYGSEIMYLPDRHPIVYSLESNRIEILKENPFAPGNPIYPVAVFNSPGHVVTSLCAYEETRVANKLPLFSYGAVGWHRNRFRSAALCVDREPRQDLRRMKREAVARGIRKTRRVLPGNRLVRHLEHCAQVYGCPAGKNFFLNRYEAPLPTARNCNARCLGCISLQRESDIPCSQARIAFTPTPDEIAQVALHHIRRVPKAVVSFGQGCEGEPLSAASVIEPAIRMIRSETDRGTINLNTNGSRPQIIERLFDAGLDSIRVSMNSVRQSCYDAYFRPAGYSFADVKNSIALALSRGKFVSINYLNLPGFTDAPEEARALFRFLGKYTVNMIQWRNLNIDPLYYLKIMRNAAPRGKSIGTRRLLEAVRSKFPQIRFGYFNPPVNRKPN